jgi:tetratricopeptide (TPR) repeat protein
MAAGGSPTYGIVGTLSAFPRRLAAREVARQGGVLRGAAARNLTHLVFGRSVLERLEPEAIEKRVEAARSAGVTVLGENGLRRVLGLTKRAADAGVSRQSLIEQAKLSGNALDLLTLFDAFEECAEPYTFRDVILGRKYGKLIEAGTGWADIARSVHRVGQVTSLTALSLHGDEGGVYLKDGDRLSEIDGQGLLPFDDEPDHERADELFAAAEAAEQEGEHLTAAALYTDYLAIVPSDAVAAFNRANALRAAGKTDDAARAYTQAIKLDPSFAEAWFNYGALHKQAGKVDLAREHFARAFALDPRYADPLYNLAALEYDAGHLSEARQFWTRYLELDSTSEWAKKASRGIQLVDMTLNAERKKGA